VVGPKAVDAAPDCVVEIVSPDTRHRDLHVKKATYARFGVQEYWIVDPDDRTGLTFSSWGYDYRAIAPNDDSSIRSLVLPALRLDLDDVFKA
jgi:Uma2 family endonuclease